MKNKQQLIRFGIVGGANTALDFGILFLLTFFGTAALIANIISTSVAFCFSFFANKKYTFKTTGTNIKREMFLFIIVTLFGLWVLQSVIITFTVPLLEITGLSEPLRLFAAKILATIVSLIWNYVMYSTVVFTHKEAK